VVFKEQFDPQTLSVKVGTAVTWFNPSSFSMHLVFQSAGFESPPSQGQPYTHVFDAAGTYPYLNSYDGTAGTIIVTK
jgi:plastocyanin